MDVLMLLRPFKPSGKYQIEHGNVRSRIERRTRRADPAGTETISKTHPNPRSLANPATSAIPGIAMRRIPRDRWLE
jgi:hypothetical protein